MAATAAAVRSIGEQASVRTIRAEAAAAAAAAKSDQTAIQLPVCLSLSALAPLSHV